MTMETLDRLRSRITSIDSMPTIPVILRPLLHCLDQPVEQIDITRIVELISYDKSIAAQCVRMANSALFRRNHGIDQNSDVVQQPRQICFFGVRIPEDFREFPADQRDA